MRVELAGETRTGRAIDLRDIAGNSLFSSDTGVAGERSVSEVVGAIRADGTQTDARRADDRPPNGRSDRSLAIDCPVPGPAHEHVGGIRAGMNVSLRPALAAAARTRGREPPQADNLAAVRDRLDALDPPAIDLRAARRRVAETGDAADELRERVAALRGRVQALRDDDDRAAAESELTDATRRLSEVETERIAAEQALARARDRAAENRERRRERLRLEDRAANLRRDAREHLAGVVREAFEEAREDVPAGVEPPVSTAVAVARVADLDAPVVVARGVGSFGGVEELSRWVDSPVVVL